MSPVQDNTRPKEAAAPPGDLLATKLLPPIMRPMLVRRARLTDILWAGMQHRVTLVVAPAGYGKTTLLGEWLSTLSAKKWPVAWVSLDTYDNDPLRFWNYVVAALRTIQPSLNFNVQTILYGKCDKKDCTLLNPLINEIADIRQHFTLVLDDYHTIHNESIHHALAYFIDYLPENCHLIFSSRTLPPLYLSRLRARGQLVEVSINNLLFTLDETNVFFSQVMKLDVSWEQVETLMAMTEGWIAGLQLAALSLKGREDTPSFISSISETPRHILDYLTEEALVRQDDAVKDFLIKTSVLEELSAPLCDAVLGAKNSREMLATLEQMNLFIVPLDNQRLWYRYHALFAELLRTQFERLQPGLAHQLHLAAYHWLVKNGYPEKAVVHALAAGENDLAAETVESCALQSIIRMDLATVLQWFRLLPQAQIENRLRLGVYWALTNLILGNMEDLEVRLNSVEHNLDDMQDGQMSVAEIARLRRYVKALRAAATCTKGDFSLGISSSQQILENLLPEDFFFLGLVEHNMGYAYLGTGRLSESAGAFERACQNALRHKIHQEFVLSRSEKARVFRLQGRLKDAAEAYRTAIDYARVHDVSDDIRICPLAGLAEIMREWNLIQEADELLNEPVHFLTYSSGKNLDWFYTIDVCLVTAKNHMLHNAYEEANKYIQRAQLGTFQFFSELYSEVSATQVQLWLMRGDLDSASSWLKRKELQIKEQAQTTSSTIINAEQIVMARVYLAMNQFEKAVRTLDMVLAIVGDGEQGDYSLKAHVIKALALWHQDRRNEAATTLCRALTLAEPEDRARLFIDEGTPMRALLLYTRESLKAARRAETKKLSSYIGRLLQQIEGLSIGIKEKRLEFPQDGQDIVSPIVEKLSLRETQILKLLSRGYTTGDIARHFVISVNTSKVHIKNIYQKLDVHSRKEAIEKAVELQLLTD